MRLNKLIRETAEARIDECSQKIRPRLHDEDTVKVVSLPLTSSIWLRALLNRVGTVRGRRRSDRMWHVTFKGGSSAEFYRRELNRITGALVASVCPPIQG